ncbi:MAG: hypothetical protein ACFCUE_02240 [Candidatus Bathyarchaeia archaeon]|jgi:hypothetical protein
MSERSTTSEAMKKGSKAMEHTAETIGDTIIQVIDKLAGKKSDLRLTFDNLSLNAQFLNATLNGSIILDVTMAKEIEDTTANM